MKKSEIEESVSKISEKIAEDLNLEFVGVDYVKEGTDMYLKIYIDKDGGVGIDDCQTFTREINPVLDKEDFIGEAYFLEVSSPGLDRPLKTREDYDRNIGENVEISLYAPIEGEKNFKAKLIGHDESSVKVEDENSKILEIEKKAIAKINRAIEF